MSTHETDKNVFPDENQPNHVANVATQETDDFLGPDLENAISAADEAMQDALAIINKALGKTPVHWRHQLLMRRCAMSGKIPQRNGRVSGAGSKKRSPTASGSTASIPLPGHRMILMGLIPSHPCRLCRFRILAATLKSYGSIAIFKSTTDHSCSLGYWKRSGRRRRSPSWRRTVRKVLRSRQRIIESGN